MSIPTGSIVWSITLTPPEGFLLCDGQAVTSATYPRLYEHLVNAGSPYGTSGGNPKVPNLIEDNRFIRAAGGGVGIGSTQSSSIVDHSHHIPTSAQPGGSGISNQSGGGGGSHFVQYYPGADTGSNTGGAGETRPVNIGLLPCIST